MYSDRGYCNFTVLRSQNFAAQKKLGFFFRYLQTSQMRIVN